MPETFTIVGSSVACLAAALQAAHRGNLVNLYIDPLRIGGSFGGIKVGKRRFDLGSRLFELDYENNNDKPVADFDPRYDSHRDFVTHVSAFIKEVLQGEILPAREPDMLIAGRTTRCSLMTVDLSALPAALPVEDQRQIREQVRDIVEAGAAAISNPGQTLHQASLAQHGQRLHELLTQAVCIKQYVAWDTVLATDRRKLWAALFHPQTVYEAFSGQAIRFQPHRPFATTQTGALHPFVEQLFQSVKACEQIVVTPVGPLKRLTFPPSRMVAFTFDNLFITVPGERCVIGEAADQVFNAAGYPYKPERITSSIVWVDVPESALNRELSTLTICDPDLPVLRISRVEAVDGMHCFAVEFGQLPACPKIAVAALRQAGIIRTEGLAKAVHQLTGPAQIAPTPTNRKSFEAAQTCLAPFDGLLLGGLRRFLFESLNDQIIDALFFGATRC